VIASPFAPSRLVSLLVLAAVLLAPSAVSADPIYTFGQTVIVETPPDDLREIVDPPVAFHEHSDNGDWVLPVDFRAPDRASNDTGPSECSDDVASFWMTTDFVFTRPDPSDLPSTDTDVIVFFGEVLGISHERSCMAYADAPFSHPGVSYPDAGGLDLGPGDRDAVEAFPSGRTVWHRMYSTEADWDGYRVFVETPAPDQIADVTLDCRPSDVTIEAGDTQELKLNIQNIGPAGAPDSQIVFRVPPGVTVLDHSGPFDCNEHAEARVHICVHDDSVFETGGNDELTLNVQFDETPTSQRRIVAFGSGAVHDPDLSNNECDVRVSGPAVDGGTDGAVPDGAVPDAALPSDTGTGPGGGPVGPSFRGAGGCACDAALAPSSPPALGLLLALFAVRLRRRR